MKNGIISSTQVDCYQLTCAIHIQSYIYIALIYPLCWYRIFLTWLFHGKLFMESIFKIGFIWWKLNMHVKEWSQQALWCFMQILLRFSVFLQVFEDFFNSSMCTIWGFIGTTPWHTWLGTHDVQDSPYNIQDALYDVHDAHNEYIRFNSRSYVSYVFV